MKAFYDKKRGNDMIGLDSSCSSKKYIYLFSSFYDFYDDDSFTRRPEFGENKQEAMLRFFREWNSLLK